MNDINILKKNALIVEDFDEAMDALHKLKIIDKSCARHVALNIINNGIGDVFYQAYAFELLYDICISDAVSFIKENAANVDSYILRSMLTCVAVDAGVVEHHDDVISAVAALRHALSVRQVDDLQKIQEQRKFFEDAYPLI